MLGPTQRDLGKTLSATFLFSNHYNSPSQTTKASGGGQSSGPVPGDSPTAIIENLTTNGDSKLEIFRSLPKDLIVSAVQYGNSLDILSSRLESENYEVDDKIPVEGLRAYRGIFRMLPDSAEVDQFERMECCGSSYMDSEGWKQEMIEDITIMQCSYSSCAVSESLNEFKQRILIFDSDTEGLDREMEMGDGEEIQEELDGVEELQETGQEMDDSEGKYSKLSLELIKMGLEFEMVYNEIWRMWSFLRLEDNLRGNRLTEVENDFDVWKYDSSPTEIFEDLKKQGKISIPEELALSSIETLEFWNHHYEYVEFLKGLVDHVPHITHRDKISEIYDRLRFENKLPTLSDYEIKTGLEADRNDLLFMIDWLCKEDRHHMRKLWRQTGGPKLIYDEVIKQKIEKKRSSKKYKYAKEMVLLHERLDSSLASCTFVEFNSIHGKKLVEDEKLEFASFPEELVDQSIDFRIRTVTNMHEFERSAAFLKYLVWQRYSGSDGHDPQVLLKKDEDGRFSDLRAEYKEFADLPEHSIIKGIVVGTNHMCLHTDGKLVGEESLTSLSSEHHFRDNLKRISLAGSDGKLDGYVYNVQVLPISASMTDQFVKNPPVKLSLDSSSIFDGVEEGGDGVWSIVGGKDIHGDDRFPILNQSVLGCNTPSKHSKLENDKSPSAIDTSGILEKDEISLKTSLEARSNNFEGTDGALSDSESTDARNYESRWTKEAMNPISDAVIFKYCLEGTYEQLMLLKEMLTSVSDEEITSFAEQVCLYAGCSHHRFQILISKRLLQEGIDTWNSITQNSHHVLWTDVVPEIDKRFRNIASSNRGLSGEDVDVLRGIAGCSDQLGQEEFARMCWPHPDAGSLVVTYVGADSTLHHKLLSLDYRKKDARPLKELLLEEPELSQLARQVTL
ncbi:hypothetical protein COCNU_07G004030 [Cocos nucifera]|uniref:Uncharacterized protein n=1 Tax=Cocos nucifera TaxID=13894 RepID=A0A8K0N4M6_COCNU|nr:hypothetical protein COCNU_07G004030 [Cocos nucifera]